MIEKTAYLEEEISKKIQFWIGRAFILGIIIFPSLGVTDYYLVTPENLIRFYIYRLGMSFALTILYYLNRIKRKILYQYALGVVAVILSTIIVEIMIMATGGHESHYYPGIILLIIAALILTPFSQLLAVSLTVMIYLIYLIPLLIWDRVINHPDFIISNVMILASAAITLSWRILSHKSMLNELILQHDLAEKNEKLENYSAQLEKTVAERTKDLTERVDELVRFQKATVQREFRMKELKDENERLKKMD